jgi:DNA polymerase III alpha subunit (gram-positive type)
MEFVSIDIETLGLCPETCDVIEFGAVLENFNKIKPIEDLPKYHAYVTKPDGIYSGQLKAMAMHEKMLHRIADREEANYIPYDCLGESFYRWLCCVSSFPRDREKCQIKITVAGKNFMSFDMRFLRRLPNFTDHVLVLPRYIDPAMLCFNPKDEVIPSLHDCMKILNMEKEVSHTALEDAIDVVRIIRRAFGEK